LERRVEDSDQRLMTLVKGGDEAAFAEIVARYKPMLLGHSRRVAGDRAEDAVQQALLNAWSALRRDHQVRELRPWLFTITHRAALQELRGQRECEVLPESLAGGRSPADCVDQAARSREALAAVAALPELERDALVSVGVHGCSGRTTARFLGVSEGMVRQLVHRGRTRVRAAVSVFVPPVLLLRKLMRAAGGTRAGARTHAFAGSGQAQVLAAVGKVVAVVGAGAAIAAATGTLQLAHNHRPGAGVPLRDADLARPAPHFKAGLPAPALATGSASAPIASSLAGSVSRPGAPGAQRSDYLAGTQSRAENGDSRGLTAPIPELPAPDGVAGTAVRQLSSRLTSARPHAKRLAGPLIEGVASATAPVSEAAQRVTAPAVKAAADVTQQLLSSSSGTISGAGAQAGGEVETAVHASAEGLGGVTGAGR
jgi:RNA polymerase sigma-70 factor (ECF subfamily)